MISYYNQDIDFKINDKKAISNWLIFVSKNENKFLGRLNVIFCSDDYLLEINKKYLSHDYYTDVITFDYSSAETVSGDLFISIDSVKSNAEYFSVPFDTELRRVIVHGLLHLIGYDDHSESDIAIMRQKENFYLEKLRKKK